MEPVHGTNKSASKDEEDIISRMPENVITNILNRLPIQDAVGTCILSSNWRFNWTLLTQLVFDINFFDSLPIEDYDWRIIISRLVIHLQGPITKFLIDIPDYLELDAENISQWVMFLSDIDNWNWVEFITKCPLLEILKFSHCEPPIGKVKLPDIAKLINLKMLYLPLYMLGNLAITSSTIYQLGCYLPKLQELTLDFQECNFIGEAVVRKWICTAFPCLKSLSLSNIDLSSSIMLSCAFEMIWGSPNLQTLEIRAVYNRVVVPPPGFYLPEEDNNTKLQLQSFVFYYFGGSENEVYFIKSLLGCSPSLKNIYVYAISFPVLGGDNVKLPSHLFSCLELKHLNLSNCCLHPPPTFRGFPNLLSLDVSAETYIGNCVEIIIKCPLLEILKITAFRTTRKVKLGEIAKLKNLKMLSLPLCLLDDVANTSSTIFQLEGYLPKLQELNLDFQESKIIEEAGERKWVCTAFPCLKKLSLYNIDLSSNILLSCAFEMIWGSPNLQTLKITNVYNGVGVPPPVFCFPKVDNNTKLQLQSVVFHFFRGSENEVYFIKTLLACSPLLHNMTIYGSSIIFNRKLVSALELLELNRASPIAKVRLY